jgi:antitoxin (DNA-binding transcriptional repressor) of toxin-antitoxin stability system
MPSATIFEAKTNLSKLVQQALCGEDVQITLGRERRPVVRLTPIKPVAASQRLGFLAGQGKVDEAFFAPLPDDELRLWNGESE